MTSIESQLTFPFANFIPTKLALLNGQRKHARHWSDLVEEKLEYGLPILLLHPTQAFPTTNLRRSKPSKASNTTSQAAAVPQPTC